MKNDEKPRSKRLTIYLTEDEYRRAKETAEWFGIPLSAMCRVFFSVVGEDEKARRLILDRAVFPRDGG